MKRFIFFTVIILFLAVLTAAFIFFVKTNNLKQTQVCIKQSCFNVEIAKTFQEKERGLMFRKNLAPNEGMLFIFEREDIYPFWMKNTLIPLDIIWIDKNKKIVFIKENAEPCKDNDCSLINPGINALYVLELKSGSVKSADIKMEGEVVVNN